MYPYNMFGGYPPQAPPGAPPFVWQRGPMPLMDIPFTPNMAFPGAMNQFAPPPQFNPPFVPPGSAEVPQAPQPPVSMYMPYQEGVPQAQPPVSMYMPYQEGVPQTQLPGSMYMPYQEGVPQAPPQGSMYMPPYPDSAPPPPVPMYMPPYPAGTPSPQRNAAFEKRGGGAVSSSDDARPASGSGPQHKMTLAEALNKAGEALNNPVMQGILESIGMDMNTSRKMAEKSKEEEKDRNKAREEAVDARPYGIDEARMTSFMPLAGGGAGGGRGEQVVNLMDVNLKELFAREATAPISTRPGPGAEFGSNVSRCRSPAGTSDREQQERRRRRSRSGGRDGSSRRRREDSPPSRSPVVEHSWRHSPPRTLQQLYSGGRPVAAGSRQADGKQAVELNKLKSRNLLQMDEQRANERREMRPERGANERKEVRQERGTNERREVRPERSAEVRREMRPERSAEERREVRVEKGANERREVRPERGANERREVRLERSSEQRREVKPERGADERVVMRLERGADERRVMRPERGSDEADSRIQVKVVSRGGGSESRRVVVNSSSSPSTTKTSGASRRAREPSPWSGTRSEETAVKMPRFDSLPMKQEGQVDSIFRGNASGSEAASYRGFHHRLTEGQGDSATIWEKGIKKEVTDRARLPSPDWSQVRSTAKQRLELLEKELDRLARLGNELTRRKRASTFNWSKDPDVVKNLQLQTELTRYTETLRTDVKQLDEAVEFDELNLKPPAFSSNSDNKFLSATYLYRDNGRYWCDDCMEQMQNLSDLVQHLRSDKHKLKISVKKKPWSASSNGVASDLKRNSPKVVNRGPIKGMEFLAAANAFHCSLCEVFVGDRRELEKHLKSREHHEIYERFLKRIPSYEKIIEHKKEYGKYVQETATKQSTEERPRVHLKLLKKNATLANNL